MRLGLTLGYSGARMHLAMDLVLEAGDETAFAQEEEVPPIWVDEAPRHALRDVDAPAAAAAPASTGTHA